MTPDYPHPFRGDVVFKYLSKNKGEQVVVPDPYNWMEDPDASATKEWVTQQNKIFEDFLQDARSTRDQLAARLRECISYPRTGVPKKHGNHYYFHHNEGLQNQSVLYRFKDSDRFALEDCSVAKCAEVFFDANVLSEDGTVSLRTSTFSESGQYWAYGLSNKGSDWMTIRVRETSTLKDLEEDVLEWTKFTDIYWLMDSTGFFYGRYDKPAAVVADDAAGTETAKAKFQRIFFHKIGTPQSSDILIHEDMQHEEWMFSVENSIDGKYLIRLTQRGCEPKNLVHIAEIKESGNLANLEWLPVVDEWIGEFYYLGNSGTQFYFQSNLDAPRGKVILVDLTTMEQRFCVDVISEHVAGGVLDEARYFGGKLMTHHQVNVISELNTWEMKEKACHLARLELPGVGSVGTLSGKWNREEVFYAFSSFTNPGAIYRFEMSSAKPVRVHQTTLGDGSLDPDNFTADQIWYSSKDGVRVPMFVVRKKELLPTISSPPSEKLNVLLYGYGGFMCSLSPYFSPSLLVGMHHLNFVYACPNLRGGGEFGVEWNNAGKLENKQNVFDDFIYAAKHLKEMGVAKNVVITGGSNGGLLVTACANQEPSMFAGVIAQVPVTDMLRFHHFTIGHAWVSEYGCADDGAFDYLVRYSPLHTIMPVKYPPMLVLTADHDDRVVPLHTCKYVAELQHTAGKLSNAIIARIETNAGHGGGKPLHKRIEEQADTYTFFSEVTGAKFMP